MTALSGLLGLAHFRVISPTPGPGVAVKPVGAARDAAFVMTMIPKLSETSLAPSVAVTFTVRRPTSLPSGVPEKVRVVALKLSQAGRAVPFCFVAL